MGRRKSFLKNQARSTEMSLQITSMADIFMILLVFLLKSYNSDVVTVAPQAGTSLPVAKLGSQVSEGLKVEISQDVVLLGGKPVARMKDFRFDGSDVDESGVSRSLLGALNKERAVEAEAKQATTNGSEAEGDPRLMVIADQRAPYQTIKTVLASAAMQGYTDIKLAVIHAD